MACRRDRSPPDASEIAETAFPAYLQSYQAFEDCSVLEDAMRDAILRQEPGEEDMVWRAIRQEAERDAAAEPLLSSFLYGSILCHDSFERALAFVLSNR